MKEKQTNVTEDFKLLSLFILYKYLTITLNKSKKLC